MPDAQQVKKRKCSSCCFPCRKRPHSSSSEPENAISEVEETTKFAEDIVQALTPGSSVIIKGKVRSECKRFAVNFLSIHGSKSDVAFHFNPRLALRYIVRNAKINNSWGDEETTSIEKFHVYRTKTFELQFVATETEFLVALNGRHVCAFVYRIPLAKINKLQVEGVEVEGVEIVRQIKSYPSVDGSVDIDSVEHKEVPSYPSEATSLTVPLGGGKEDRVLDQQLITVLYWYYKTSELSLCSELSKF